MEEETRPREEGAGARRKEGVARLELRPRAPAPQGGPPGQAASDSGRVPSSRWTAGRKLEVVLRLLRGEGRSGSLAALAHPRIAQE